MNAKILFMLLTLTFAVLNAAGQGHDNSKGGCKLFKNHVSTGYTCPACDAKDKKEQAARDAEDKRRSDAVNAKWEAEKKATENLRLEKLRLVKEEEKRIKDKAIADQVAHNNEMRRNKETAANGEIKSNVKGLVEKIDPSTVTTFEDNSRRIYGLISNGKEVLTFPYEESRTTIRKIAGTNLFEVMVMGKHPNGWEKYLYSFIIDYHGKKLSVNGINKFDYPIAINTSSNKMYLYKKLAEPEREGNKCPEAQTFGVVFQSKEAAVADISKGTGRTCITQSMVSSNVAVYSVDYNFKLLEQVNGFVMFHFSWSGLFRD